VTRGSPWLAWNVDPAVLAALAVAAWAYWRGLRVLWGRGTSRRGVKPWQAAAFGAGLAAVFVALVSPLDALSEDLLSAHMVQHLLLMLVAAPLLVLGSPAIAVSQAVPERWRRRLRVPMRSRALRRLADVLFDPITAWLLALVALWAWHAPVPYRAAVDHDGVHILQHGAFLGTALLFWWGAIQPSGRRRLPRGLDVLYVFGGALQGGALGALFVFAAQPLYPFYAVGARAWGLTPLQDQQLAGVAMWVPSFFVHVAAAAALFVRWLRAAEREVRWEEAKLERPVGVRSG
jgi:putative membrane protein